MYRARILTSAAALALLISTPVYAAGANAGGASGHAGASVSGGSNTSSGNAVTNGAGRVTSGNNQMAAPGMSATGNSVKPSVTGNSAANTVGATGSGINDNNTNNASYNANDGTYRSQGTAGSADDTTDARNNTSNIAPQAGGRPNFATIDTDRNGTVSANEFKVMGGTSNIGTFAKIDSNHDGVLTDAELSSYSANR